MNAPVPIAATPARCPLTAYQIIVVKWMASGKRDLEIANLLGNTTEDAIKQHIYRIMNTLGAATRPAIIAIAMRKGWIE